MRCVRGVLMAASAWAVLGGGPAAAQTLDEIIARNLAARGGVEKLRGLDTVKITGTITINMIGPPGSPPKAITVPMTTWAKRPNRMRRDQQFPDRTVSVGFDGTTVWVLDSAIGTTQKMTGPNADATRDDANFDPLFLAYEERGHEIELVGQEKLDGVDVHHLRVAKKNGQVDHHYLRADTGLEFRTVTAVQQGGTEVELRTDLTDYRIVDGMQVAFGMQQFRNSQPVLRVELTDVAFDVPIDEEVFRMPAGGVGRR